MTDAEKLRRIRDIVSLCNTPCSRQIKTIIDGEAHIVNKNVMININGRNFHCDCGTDVFTKYDNGTYTCNGCKKEYLGI